MSNFETAADFTYKWEGGIVNDPSDPGGLTNGGISQRSYPHIDIAKLDKDGIYKIYKTDFWDKMSCDILPLPVSLALFDCAIHSGVKRSMVFIQDVLHIKRTGVMDFDTKKAIAAFVVQNSALELAIQLISRRVKFLVALCRKSPKMNKFLRGWMNRVLALTVAVKHNASQ